MHISPMAYLGNILPIDTSLSIDRAMLGWGWVSGATSNDDRSIDSDVSIGDILPKYAIGDICIS